MRINFKLNLSQKAFLLIAVPLVAELLVLGCLAHALAGAEQEIRKERHARSVVMESNILLNNFLDCSIYLYEVGRLRKPGAIEQFDQMFEQIPLRIRSLKIALRDSPNQVQALERIELVSGEAVGLLGQVRKMAMEGAGIADVQDLRTRLSNKATVMVAALRKFAREQEQALVVMPEREAQARFRIVQILSTGVFLSVLIAVLLAMTFNRTTARRMSVLMDNTKRLAQGQKLNPLLEGDDEIGHLDQVFHEMAGALADASRRKAELMSMVSHDLRTPLTSMQGSMTLLAAGIMGELTPKAVHEVSRAERNATRLINLINDLLDIEKLEAGQMDMVVDDILLQPVFEESLESVAQFASSHSVKMDIEPTGLQVLADHNRLIQVLINLMSNAIKFSPEGETVRLLAKDDGKMVEVQVVDKGRGVPESHREAIFERFKQVEAADATEKKGTGLGLPICKLIVESHGGTIGVTSEAGSGSTFWFKIPKSLS
jgi:signal transduction histidine kinase